jgi:hypothetical protein
MKKIVLLVAVLGLVQYSYTNSGGSPSGRSGSPASNGQTCSGGYCHSGGSPSGNEQIIIQTDQANLVDNQAVNVSLGVLPSGASSKIGFMASVEDASGNSVSSITASSNSKKVGNYLTHTSSSTSVSNDSIGWNFTFEDSSYPDSLTIYVAVNFTNGNGNYQGDYVLTETKTLYKSQSSVDESSLKGLIVGPNPATDFIKIQHEDLARVGLYNTLGRFISLETSANSAQGTIDLDVSTLARGNYIIKATYLDGTTHYKHVILK